MLTFTRKAAAVGRNSRIVTKAYASGWPREPRRERGASENLPVFQVVPYGKCTLDDVDDALSMCKGVSLNHARDICYSLGIDYDNAVKYYQTVKYLENCWKKDANWNQRVISWNLYVLSELVEYAITKIRIR
jgi:hypothetical protein